MSTSTPSLVAGVSSTGKANLLGCTARQQLVSQTPSCPDEIAATGLQMETFQGELVRDFAPDSLAAKDGRLQADLFTAYTALGAMASALSAGDQIGLQAGHEVLRQALGSADSDAAQILKVS